MKTKLLSCFLVIAICSAGQTNKELAVAKAREAIKLEDQEGRYDEAIVLLQEAQKLDPDDYNYPYELAFAYTHKKEYKKASDILEKLIKRDDINGRVYQALGNAYDYQGKADKAIDTYEKGLKRFPQTGELYLEMGNMKLVKNDYDNAITYYEKGIEMDPAFPSNYYWASKIFCSSTEEVWGMIYGEIFMNLERNSKRTAEISKLLYDKYKSEITFTSDTSYGVSFSQYSTININNLKDPSKIILPFGTGCYEMVLMIAVLGENQINIASLNSIRTRFLETYFNTKHANMYPNILFDYQQKIKDAGHFEAYNYWLLMKGEETAFINWKANNADKWNAFLEWYSQNKLAVTPGQKFYRAQYD